MKSFDGKRYFSKVCDRAEADTLKAWTRARGISSNDFDIAGHGSDILFSWWLEYPDVLALVNFLDDMGV